MDIFFVSRSRGKSSFKKKTRLRVDMALDWDQKIVEDTGGQWSHYVCNDLGFVTCCFIVFEVANIRCPLHHDWTVATSHDGSMLLSLYRPGMPPLWKMQLKSRLIGSGSFSSAVLDSLFDLKPHFPVLNEKN